MIIIYLHYIHNMIQYDSMIFNMSWLSILFLNYFLSPSFLPCFILSLLVAYLLPFHPFPVFLVVIWYDLNSHLISSLNHGDSSESEVKTLRLHPSPSSKPKHLADLAFNIFNSMIFHDIPCFQDLSRQQHCCLLWPNWSPRTWWAGPPRACGRNHAGNDKELRTTVIWVTWIQNQYVTSGSSYLHKTAPEQKSSSWEWKLGPVSSMDLWKNVVFKQIPLNDFFYFAATYAKKPEILLPTWSLGTFNGHLPRSPAGFCLEELVISVSTLAGGEKMSWALRTQRNLRI